MAKFFVLSCLVLFSSLVWASSSSGELLLPCPPSLESVIGKIEVLPEGKTLVQSILKEGKVRVALSDHPLARQFGAFWDPDLRVVFVNRSWHGSEGEVIASILFELHNASITKKIDHLDALASARQIGRDAYVESMEYLEYQNSIQASAMAKKGVEGGIFPPTTHLFTYSSFDEHFWYQKKGGHSAMIAKNYDQLAR